MRATPGRLHAADGDRRECDQRDVLTRISISISSATWRRSPASSGCRTCSKCIPTCRRAPSPELIAYAKANPDKLIAGSAGNRQPGHVSAELFKMMTGIKMLHVPYRGIAPALADLLGGRIHVLVDNMATAIEHDPGRQGARARRHHRVPLAAPARRPDHRRIACRATKRAPGTASRRRRARRPRSSTSSTARSTRCWPTAAIVDAVFRPGRRCRSPGSPADFGKLIADETEKWGRVVRFAGAKPEHDERAALSNRLGFAFFAPPGYSPIP